MTPQDVPPPFFRFVYDADTGRFTITAHETASPDQSGALFGAALEKEAFVALMTHWMVHLERGESNFGSLPAESKLGSELAQLKEELRVTDELLNEQRRVMDEIPECPAHGAQCVPWAIEWVRRAKRVGH